MTTTFEIRDYDEQPETPITPNAVECTECSMTYTGKELASIQNDQWDICPEDSSHLASPLYISKEPLGLPHDDEHFHFGHKQYEYGLEAL